MIDLRSDTVTRPTHEMRRAMAEAEVGDDGYREDPTVRRLEETVASLLGKQAALFVPSGTMANQLALLALTRRGDEVVCGDGAHLAWYESGAGAALAGVQFAVAGSGGLFSVDEMLAAAKPTGPHYPRTSVVALENTHNRSGGRIFPQTDVEAIGARAHALGLRVHLDGSRLWNTAAVLGRRVDELAQPADTVNVCFSKGLGAPVGSALAGPHDVVDEARRLRKMLGGTMRQAGVLAAGALYALEHHRARLVEDHARATAFARALVERTGGTGAEIVAPETNMVVVRVHQGTAESIARHAETQGLRVGVLDPSRLRAVFHLDLGPTSAEQAADTLARVIAFVARPPQP